MESGTPGQARGDGKRGRASFTPMPSAVPPHRCPRAGGGHQPPPPRRACASSRWAGRTRPSARCATGSARPRCRRWWRVRGSIPVTARIASDDQIGERARLGEERLARNQRIDASRAGASSATIATDLGFQRVTRLLVVEADVEPRARRAGDDVGGGIADLDVGDFEVGGLEPVIAVVEVPAASADRGCATSRRHRIVGEVRVGDMALRAGHLDPGIDRSAPADLDRVAEPRVGGRLADQARGPAGCPRSAIQSMIARVPWMAGPSSSPVISRLSVPAWPCTRSAAAMKAAIAPFMSTAPRP